jgi:hypothetical protein
MRYRHTFLGIGSFLVAVLWLLSDPDLGLITKLGFGASTLATFIITTKAVIYIGLLHLGRKALVDYIDLEVYFNKALQSSEGSGYAIMAISVMMLSISVLIFAAVSN